MSEQEGYYSKEELEKRWPARQGDLDRLEAIIDQLRKDIELAGNTQDECLIRCSRPLLKDNIHRHKAYSIVSGRNIIESAISFIVNNSSNFRHVGCSKQFSSAFLSLNYILEIMDELEKYAYDEETKK